MDPDDFSKNTIYTNTANARMIKECIALNPHPFLTPARYEIYMQSCP